MQTKDFASCLIHLKTPDKCQQWNLHYIGKNVSKLWCQLTFIPVVI